MNPRSVGLRAGADGWRGLLGSSFTPQTIRVLARCIATEVMGSGPSGRVLVTFDGREAGIEAARQAAQGACEAGADSVRIIAHLPTPTAAFALSQGHADLALLVTASHNPPQWNGLKVKVSRGHPLPPELEAAAERRYRTELKQTSPEPSPDAVDRIDVEPSAALIQEQIIDSVPRALPPRGGTIVVDGLSGIAGDLMVRLCGRLGWNVHPVGCRPRPDFAGVVPDPSLEAARRRAANEVRRGAADFGIVVDGDGDRIFVVDGRGRTVPASEFAALLLRHRRRCGTDQPTAGLAVTTAAGTVIRRAATELGKTVTERPIGFKHLSPLLLSGDCDAGAGSVGDIAFTEFGVDRNPVGAVVILADLLGSHPESLPDLIDLLRDDLGRFSWFEDRVDDGGSLESLADVGSRALVARGLDASLTAVQINDGAKFLLDDGCWILLRRASTESGIRVYGEFLEAPFGRRESDEFVRAVRTELALTRTSTVTPLAMKDKR